MSRFAAIGTGETATPQQAQAMHAHIVRFWSIWLDRLLPTRSRFCMAISQARQCSRAAGAVRYRRRACCGAALEVSTFAAIIEQQ